MLFRSVRQRTGDSLPNNCGSACASTSPEPRRADTRRSCCVCVCASQKSQFRRPANGRDQERGRKPPVVREPRLPGRFRTRSHSTTGHAGPRPGGVSPPWFGNRACEEDSAHVRTRPPDARETKSGGRKPRVDHGNALAMTMPHTRETTDGASANRIAIAVAAITAV